MTASVEIIPSRLLTLTEVGARIDRCERTVRSLIASNRLKAGRLRGRLLLHENEVNRFLEERRKEAAQSA